MEKDLESQVENLLGRLLNEHLVSPAGKAALSRWFIDRLETERRGWKGRLRDASRATDSEHRLALASQAIIQRVNQQMKDRVLPRDVAVADSDDNDGAVDKRMERLQVIERNWDTASQYIDKLERDRTDCLQVLGVSSDSADIDIVVELRSRLEAAGLVATSSSMTQQDDTSVAAAVAAEAAKHESTIAELKRNNDSLKAKLKSIYKSSQDAKQRHAKDVAKLKKTVTELQQQKQQQREREQQTAETEKAGQRTSAAAQVSGEVVATSTETRGGVVLPPVNVASPQLRLSLTNPLQANSAAADPHHNTIIHSSVTQAAGPPSPVTMPPLALPRNSPTTTPRAIPPTTAIVLPSLATTDNSAYQNNTADQSPTSLRNQVLGFANRLADARREVADCQRALIRLQQATVTAATPAPSTHRSHKNAADNDDNRTPRRRQRLQLAAKSVTTIRLQPAAAADQQLTPRSRASESTYRLMKDDDSPTSMAAVLSSYNMFARQQKTPRRYWRC